MALVQGEGSTPGETAAPTPALPPGELSAPPVDVEAEEKARAAAQLKAAIQQSLQRKVPKPNTDALLALCSCLRRRGEEPIFGELAKVFRERLGEEVMVPLMGVRRRAAPVPQEEAKRYISRVKSYNTRKGFGFIDGGMVHRDIFVYNNRLVGRIGLIAGEIVEFELIWDGSRPQARAVRVLDPADNHVMSFDRPGQAGPMAPPAPGPSGPTSAVKNPLNAMKQAMMQPEAERLKEKDLEAELAQKIREAQTAAASDKRQPARQEPEWKSKPSEHLARAPVGDDKFTDDGNIPRGATVQVTNFPATDVNNQTGLVQGYDAATARYSVLVQMHKPNEGSSETVPLQLREEYLMVTHVPAEARARRPAAPSPPGPMPIPANSALKRSAEDALKRFNMVPAPNTAGQMVNQMGKGGLMPAMSPGKGARPGPMPGQMPGQVPGQMSGHPGPMHGQRDGRTDLGPSTAPKATGMRLEQFARPGAGAPQSALPSGPAVGMPPVARQPLIPAAPQPAPKAEPKKDQKKPHVSEGRPGAIWRVLQSKEFQDVIIRETQEVTSPLMDRIKPGETCVQRGETVELLSGLVRMPIKPNGWVTVHARLIGGPTFMEELRDESAGSRGAAPVPRAATTRPGPAAPKPLIPAAPSMGPSTGPSFEKQQMLKFQQLLSRTQQPPRDVLRTLRMPGMESGAERKHRGDKDRKKPERDDERRSPQRERRDEGPLSQPARPQPQPQQPSQASGEEKKADCPTQ